MLEHQVKGINKEAFKLVICHCPPSLDPEIEIRLTKLVTTALLVGIERDWLMERLEDCDEANICRRIRLSIH